MKSPAKAPPAGLVLLFGAAVLLPVFGLYLSTLAPTVLYYDSGTLQTKAYVLGIGHPTGYPTFIMLGKLFTYLPFGDPAYRVNLSSATYGALAAVMVYLTSLRLTGGRNPLASATASALAAIAFAASPLFWSLSVVTEVYTLNALLLAATFYTFLLWRDSRRDWHLLLAWFLAGLSVTAHMTSGLLLPVGIIFMLAVDRRTFLRPKLLLKGAASLLLGLSPYLYLPLRASMSPPMNYADPSDLEGLIFLLSGGHFKAAMFAYGPQQIPGRIEMYTSHLLQQFPSLLLGAAIVGVLVLTRWSPAGLLLTGAFLLGYLVYVLEYSIGDIETFFVPTYLILSLFIAAGLEWFLRNLLELPGPSPLYSAAFALLVAGVLLASVYASYSDLDRSDDYAASRNVEVVAKRTERGATMLAGQELAALQYMQLVEKRRQDLELVMISSQNLGPRARATAKEGPTYLLGSPDSPPRPREGVEFSRLEDDLYRVTPAEE